MIERTYSVEEAAAIILGPGPGGGDPEPSKVNWLRRHIRGDVHPQLPGYRVRSKWRMTESDIETAIELLRPKRAAPTPEAVVEATGDSGQYEPGSIAAGLSERSRRLRLRGMA
ncbi:hypothetical protein AWB98_30005 [Mycolicibacterium conceptionense]|uniref:Uncharacterized protein n=1 Tax=Mycolicibacterium conceptionense TaxID=451644 RepID=A0ABX3UYM8_9MYCO|nr:hypothetical protein AWB98_30005 [Mycolicibacterium conceptionense]